MASRCGLGLPTLHDTAQGIEHGLGGEVFGGDEIDEVLLSVFLLEAVVRSLGPGPMAVGHDIVGLRGSGMYLFDYVEDGRVGLLEPRG